ncbi:MAG: NosD domain-containing protein, partial [Planctomycetota bacterium]
NTVLNFGGWGVALGSNSVVLNNSICYNPEPGIMLSGSNSVLINNNLSYNGGALQIHGNENLILDNAMKESWWGDGIAMENSTGNTIKRNNITGNNDTGIYLENSSHNVIYLNSFNNTDNAESYNSSNPWNSTEKIDYSYNGTEYTSFMGNYWSDYNGTDSSGDGIGDTSYSIDSDKDYHPLMQPSDNYVTANQPPVANFTFTPLKPSVGETVVLNSSSHDPDGYIVSYMWDLDNDGLYDDAKGATVAHNWSTEGDYTVSLKVTDNNSDTATGTANVTVKEKVLWSYPLSVSNEGSSDGAAFGVAEDATDGYDPWCDEEEPAHPTVVGEVSAYFVSTNGETHDPLNKSYTRPADSLNYSLMVDMGGLEEPTSSVIVWDKDKLSEGCSFLLVDLIENKAIDMKNSSSYSFTYENPYSFRIEVEQAGAARTRRPSARPPRRSSRSCTADRASPE